MGILHADVYIRTWIAKQPRPSPAPAAPAAPVVPASPPPSEPGTPTSRRPRRPLPVFDDSFDPSSIDPQDYTEKRHVAKLLDVDGFGARSHCNLPIGIWDFARVK